MLRSTSTSWDSSRSKSKRWKKQHRDSPKASSSAENWVRLRVPSALWSYSHLCFRLGTSATLRTVRGQRRHSEIALSYPRSRSSVKSSSPLSTTARARWASRHFRTHGRRATDSRSRPPSILLCRSSSSRRFSEPALAAEIDDLGDRRREDQEPRPGVAVVPVVLRRVDEVLTVEPDDERRDEQDRRDCAQPFHDLVLIDGDAGLLVVPGRGEEVARVLEAFRRPEQLVVGRPELLLDLPREDLACEQRAALDVDPAVDHLPHRVPRWRQRLSDVQQVAPELRDPPADLLSRPRVDAHLELLHLVIEVVQQVDVALGDVVDQQVGDHPRRVLVGNRVARVADVARVVRWPPAGRLADRDDSVAAEDEVDLLVVDDVLLGYRNGGEQQAEDVVAVALDAGARHTTVRVCRAHELAPGVGAHLVRDVLAQLLLGRVEEIGPGGSRYAARVEAASARRLRRDAPSERARPPDDPRPTGAARRRVPPWRRCPPRSRPGGTCGPRRRRPRTRP